MQTKERYQLQRLTLLALLTAMCVVLRIFKIIDIPNVQPVTDIIMLTTLSQPKDKERAEGLGVDDYMVKSQVVIGDVVARVKHHLGEGR